MSIRIGSNIPSFYNSNRINQTPDIDNTPRIEQQSQVNDQKEGRNSAGQYISQEHGGVVQTRVADANSFKKAQLDGNRERIEEMANKLYSKLPDIFADMSRLTTGSDDQTAASRVAVNERNVAAVADKQADQTEQLVNFTL
ncbi:MAG: hypothetical protein K6G42_06890 [Lachnospiraceae bacterium]|nr:hypothetical protein [Lachnospiraceae bacterium]